MRLLIGISGASGTIYGIRMLEILKGVPDVETHLVMSRVARPTIVLESEWTLADVESLADVGHRFADVAEGPSSGSFRLDAMAVVPCSMKTMAAIAYSFGDNLLTRAADVTLKERRPSCSRHGRHRCISAISAPMVQLAEMGAILVPPMPAFYQRPRTVDDPAQSTTLSTSRWCAPWISSASTPPRNSSSVGRDRRLEDRRERSHVLDQLGHRPTTRSLDGLGPAPGGEELDLAPLHEIDLPRRRARLGGEVADQG